MPQATKMAILTNPGMSTPAPVMRITNIRANAAGAGSGGLGLPGLIVAF